MKSSSLLLPHEGTNKKPSIIIFLIAGSLGIALSAVVLPLILPGMIQSLAGADNKAFWYLSRALAIISYLFIWISVVWGLLMTTKLSRIWPGHAATADLHKFISILGLSLATLHGLILMGDKYMNMSLAQVFIPFSVQSYRPGWVGLGQVSLYFLALIVVSFYFRQVIGQKTLALHSLSELFHLFCSVDPRSGCRIGYHDPGDVHRLLPDRYDGAFSNLLPNLLLPDFKSAIRLPPEARYRNKQNRAEDPPPGFYIIFSILTVRKPYIHF